MDYPEKNIAKRFVFKRSLKPPIDIFQITNEYALLEIETIPFEIDGISLNLKVPGKKPHIILNDQPNLHRMRFTLAHELGHILIPWHMGNIIDITKESKYRDEYSILESEANRFASELLMPSNWVEVQIAKFTTPEKITKNIVKMAHVSSFAATISLIRIIDPGYVFALINEDNEVISSGRSNGTLANQPEWGIKIDPPTLFPFCKTQYRFVIDGNIFVWWHFTDKVNPKRSRDLRTWREILNQIIDEIGIPEVKKAKFKTRLNGIIAYANSQVRGDSRRIKSLYSACLQRIYSKNDLRIIAEHPKFESFLFKKITDLLNR